MTHWSSSDRNYARHPNLNSRVSGKGLRVGVAKWDNSCGKLEGMKVIVLYHPHSDHSRTVEDFARDFSRQMAHDLELISLESRDGAAMAMMYDIVRYPAIVALNNSGGVMKIWEGPVMPLMNELAYYTQS